MQRNWKGKLPDEFKRKRKNLSYDEPEDFEGDESDEEPQQTRKKPRYNEDEEENPLEPEEGGVKLEPFNLREERTKGDFDATGFYLERKEKRNREDEDGWLEEYNFHVAKMRQKENEIDKSETFSSNSSKKQSSENLLTTSNPFELKDLIINILKPGESISKALRRLQGTGNTKQAKGAKPSELNSFQTSEDKKNFEILTDAAHILFTTGYSDIYSDTKEQIMNSFARKEKSSNYLSNNDSVFSNENNNNTEEKELENETNTENDDLWEYEIDGEKYGPFTSEEMIQWINMGYFTKNIVKIRKMSKESIFDDDELPYFSSDKLSVEDGKIIIRND